MGVASKATAFLFLLNILFLAVVVSPHSDPCPPPSAPKAHRHRTPKCPKDTLKFGVCGSWLGLVREVVVTKPSPECCSLVSGLADLEAAVCLCTAIKADVLDVVKVKVNVALSLLLNGCGKKIPQGFVCK